MEYETRLDDDRALEASPRRTRRRRHLAGAMAVVVVGAVAAVLSPVGVGPAPESANAFPAAASIRRVVAGLAQPGQNEKPRPTLHGAAPAFAAPATAKGKSANGKKAPASGKKTPASGEQATASGKQEPARGGQAGRAAEQTARRFAEAFVLYEVDGVDSGVREAFGQTSTKQLSRSLLQRPPRQPAGVEVPQAKVVNVVAGPSRGGVHSFSVSLLRVGVTSELRLALEQGVGKKWQVTNVLG